MVLFIVDSPHYLFGDMIFFSFCEVHCSELITEHYLRECMWARKFYILQKKQQVSTLAMAR